MMEYREVYFRIRSAYQYDSGWPDKGAERAFREESRRLFQSAGILISRNIPVTVCIKIIRPPLHHLDPLFQIFSLVNIGRADAASLLMTHLLFNGFFAP